MKTKQQSAEIPFFSSANGYEHDEGSRLCLVSNRHFHLLHHFDLRFQPGCATFLYDLPVDLLFSLRLVSLLALRLYPLPSLGMALLPSSILPYCCRRCHLFEEIEVRGVPVVLPNRDPHDHARCLPRCSDCSAARVVGVAGGDAAVFDVLSDASS